MKNMKVRIPMYFVGLFIMTIGIALSVKSNLGVSPVSSIPYTMTCVWGIEMGKATIIFHAALVLIQILLLRKRFKPINLLQVVVGIVFGYFTTFCNYLATFLPSTEYSDENCAYACEYCIHSGWNLFLSAGQSYSACRRGCHAGCIRGHTH